MLRRQEPWLGETFPQLSAAVSNTFPCWINDGFRYGFLATAARGCESNFSVLIIKHPAKTPCYIVRIGPLVQQYCARSIAPPHT